MMIPHKSIAATLFCVLALALSTIALAQDNYPSSTIKLIMGFPPGGSTDVLARLMAQKLSAQMNAQATVEYRIGYDGHIGAEFVAKSKPDGYTVSMIVPSQILGPAFGLKLRYDVFKDLTPVALLSDSPQLLVVHPSLPVNTPAEFIAFVKARPGELAYSSPGRGSSSDLSTLLFLQTHRLTALHVPYKGSGPATLGLIAGDTQFAIQSIVASLPMVKAKRLKALAISSLTRSPLLPDVPTLSETVMPNLKVGAWVGALVPAKTPAAIVKRLNDEMAKALRDPAVRSQLQTQAIEPIGSTPEEFGAFLRSEFERWREVIKAAGIEIK